MTPTPNDLITDLDALTHELRRVAVRKARVHAWCEFVKEAMGQPEKENPPRGGDYAEHRGDGRATKNLSTAINGDEAGFSNS